MIADETPAGPENDQWELWEVFVQGSAGQAHEHVGSLRAADAELALQNARDVFARRGKVCSIWVVRAMDIAASTPEDAGAFFDPANDKAYRHPQFYKLPRGMSSE
jgi:ring-1,2-phenylacetyl-CoA epoxidase subunit PaaB